MFEKKVVVITGAARGIGRACARAFAHDGAWVALMDVDADVQTVALQLDGLGFHGNLVDESDRMQFMEAVVERWGRVDVLINNAATSMRGTAADIGLTDWRRILEVKLTAPLHLAKMAVPQMEKNGGGAIINVSSVQGLFAEPANVAYDTTKAGLINLTRSMALDLAPMNIRVNAVAPGAIATESLLHAIERSEDPEQTRRDWEELHALRRLGQPEEVADAILYLAGEHASFITGAVLPIDGGMTASFMMAGRPV